MKLKEAELCPLDKVTARRQPRYYCGDINRCPVLRSGSPSETSFSAERRLPDRLEGLITRQRLSVKKLG